MSTQTTGPSADDNVLEWFDRLAPRNQYAILRATLGAGMSDRTWATYWKAERLLNGLIASGGPDVREDLYRAADRGGGRLNVSKFARLADDAVRSWLLTDAGRAYRAAILQNGETAS